MTVPATRCYKGFLFTPNLKGDPELESQESGEPVGVLSDVGAQVYHLLVGAIPTMLVLVVFYAAARKLFFQPLLVTLEQRHLQSDGARREAARLTAAAQDREEAYQRAVLRIQNEIFAEQEAARRAALAERTETLQAARQRAAQRVLATKRQLAAELSALQAEIEQHSARLAEQLVQAIAGEPLTLPPRPEVQR